MDEEAGVGGDGAGPGVGPVVEFLEDTAPGAEVGGVSEVGWGGPAAADFVADGGEEFGPVVVVLGGGPSDDAASDDTDVECVLEGAVGAPGDAFEELGWSGGNRGFHVVGVGARRIEDTSWRRGCLTQCSDRGGRVARVRSPITLKGDATQRGAGGCPEAVGAGDRIRRGSVGLAESGAGDVELAAVLCDGAACDLDAAFFQGFGEALVGEGFGLVLGVDHFLEGRLDRGP